MNHVILIAAMLAAGDGGWLDFLPPHPTPVATPQPGLPRDTPLPDRFVGPPAPPRPVSGIDEAVPPPPPAPQPTAQAAPDPLPERFVTPAATAAYPADATMLPAPQTGEFSVAGAVQLRGLPDGSVQMRMLDSTWLATVAVATGEQSGAYRVVGPVQLYVRTDGQLGVRLLSPPIASAP